MASRFMKLFFDPEKVAANNAKFKARIAEIDENSAKVKAAIADARVQNLDTLKTELALNNADFKRKWNRKVDA